MNMRIALGAALVLALGSAAAGSTFKNAAGSVEELGSSQDQLNLAAVEVTPEMLAHWQATAASSDYSSARLPI